MGKTCAGAVALAVVGLSAAFAVRAQEANTAIAAQAGIRDDDDKKVMTDGSHVIELHHLQGNGHNEGFIVAWLPKFRILVEADAYNRPADPNVPFPTPPSPYTVNLADNIERLKIDPHRIIAVHAPADGRVVTKTALLRAVGRSAPPTQ